MAPSTYPCPASGTHCSHQSSLIRANRRTKSCGPKQTEDVPTIGVLLPQYGLLSHTHTFLSIGFATRRTSGDHLMRYLPALTTEPFVDAKRQSAAPSCLPSIVRQRARTPRQDTREGP